MLAIMCTSLRCRSKWSSIHVLTYLNRGGVGGVNVVRFETAFSTGVCVLLAGKVAGEGEGGGKGESQRPFGSGRVTSEPFSPRAIVP